MPELKSLAKQLACPSDWVEEEGRHHRAAHQHGQDGSCLAGRRRWRASPHVCDKRGEGLATQSPEVLRC